MIEKTKTSRLLNFFGYIFGNDPQDEWVFQIDGTPCRILNGWRSGASLYIDGHEQSRSGKQFVIDATKPLLTGKIVNSNGEETIVSVHMKAITGIKIQIRKNDEPIHDGFL